MTRGLVALALSAQQPLSEVKTWTDREIATAWELLRETEQHVNDGPARTARRAPGAGGPQYSG